VDSDVDHDGRHPLCGVAQEVNHAVLCCVELGVL
jgi:hypothetical protein